MDRKSTCLDKVWHWGRFGLRAKQACYAVVQNKIREGDEFPVRDGVHPRMQPWWASTLAAAPRLRRPERASGGDLNFTHKSGGGGCVGVAGLGCMSWKLRCSTSLNPTQLPLLFSHPHLTHPAQRFATLNTHIPRPFVWSATAQSLSPSVALFQGTLPAPSWLADPSATASSPR